MFILLLTFIFFYVLYSLWVHILERYDFIEDYDNCFDDVESLTANSEEDYQKNEKYKKKKNLTLKNKKNNK